MIGEEMLLLVEEGKKDEQKKVKTRLRKHFDSGKE